MYSALNSSGRWSIALAIGIFSALSLWAGISSEGFLEADACAHYLYARFAFQEPHFLVNVWGRPICTALYAIPAVMAGRFGVHLMSLALAIGCALVAYRIAVSQQYRWPTLALIFTLAQPLVFLHSFSELTELPFALLFGLAFWAYQKRQFLVMAIIVGLTPLSRPEGFGLLGLAAVALLVYRRWWWLVVLVIPTVLWNHMGWLMYGQPRPWWRWLIDNWPYAGDSLYRPGSAFHFVMLMPAVVSPFVFPAMCVGVRESLTTKDEGRRMKDDNGSASSFILHPSSFERQAFIALLPLMILLGHSVLYATGKLASSGEIRYMLVAAPFWGLLSAKGWEWIFTRLNWRRPLLAAGVAALMPIPLHGFYKVLPLVLDADWCRARRAAVWYQRSGISQDFPRIASAHQGILYFLDVAPTDGSRVVDWRKDVLDRPRPGTVVVWDPMYSIYNSDANRAVPLDELLAAGWIDVTDRVPTLGKDWHVLLSPTDIRGRNAGEQEILHSP